MFLCRTNEPAKETTMRKTHARIGSLAFILATAFFLTPVSAQERCKVDEEVLAKNTTYTEQHAMDVGDIPGHQSVSSSAPSRTTGRTAKASSELDQSATHSVITTIVMEPFMAIRLLRTRMATRYSSSWTALARLSPIQTVPRKVFSPS
jgi:hypothetical protein